MSHFKFLAYSFICLFAYLLIAQAAHAASSCTPIYGGGPTCTDTSFTIEKEVLNPATNTYVHNLGMTDTKFHANDTVSFRITLTNNGATPIRNINVKDTFPNVLVFAKGPGTFDETTNSLTYQVTNLASHHSQVLVLTARVVPQSEFPAQNAFCVSNLVSGLPSSGLLTQDASQLCVEKLSTTPATGPQTTMLLTLLAAAGAGIFVQHAAKRRSA